MSVRIAFTFVCMALLNACSGVGPGNATLVDGEGVYAVGGNGRVPSTLIQKAGPRLAQGDRVLNRGLQVDPDLPIPGGIRVQLQIRRGVEIFVNGSPLTTAAATVGEALAEAGNKIVISDVLVPGPSEPVSAGLQVTFRPARSTNVLLDGKDVGVKIAEGSIFGALADAGVPVLGLDVVWSTESGDIQFGRISESLVLVQEPIPYEVEAQESSDLELGLEQVVRAGMPGLNVTRTRIRYQDGAEIARQSEPASVVRPPQDRLVVRGSKIVEKRITLDGISFTYWRALQMYATVYSPCNSGTPDGSCSTGTASGLPAGRGVVAVDPDMFTVLSGQRLYIPGYGYAVVGDVGGGYIVEQQLGISRYKWIDLGFDDDNIQDMSGWITVYFLAPAPATIPDVLR